MASHLRAVPGPSPTGVQPESDATPIELGLVPELRQAYEQHADEVFRWAQRLGLASADAQDVVQEVFIVAHRRLPSLRRGTSLRSWIFGITRRVVNHDRERQRRRDRIDALETQSDERTTEATPQEDLERLQELRRGQRILDTMRESERTVILLFELEGLSGQEVAELLGLKLSQMWGLLRRARVTFLRRLGACEGHRARGGEECRPLRSPPPAGRTDQQGPRPARSCGPVRRCRLPVSSGGGLPSTG